MNASHSSSPSSSPSRSRDRRGQGGLSLIGLLFWGAILAVVAVVGMKVFPTVLEYFTVQRVVDKIAANNPGTVTAARQEFDRFTQVEYSIQSIKSSDLVISKDGNDKVVIEFAWDKEIDMFGPVFLVIKYRGKSR